MRKRARVLLCYFRDKGGKKAILPREFSDPEPKARVGMGFPEAKWLFSRVAKVTFWVANGYRWVEKYSSRPKKKRFQAKNVKWRNGLFLNLTIWPKFRLSEHTFRFSNTKKKWGLTRRTVGLEMRNRPQETEPIRP